MLHNKILHWWCEHISCLIDNLHKLSLVSKTKIDYTRIIYYHFLLFSFYFFHSMSWLQTPVIWKNWVFSPREDVQDHHINHSLHYGTGVFEWMRFYNTSQWPKIFRLDDHITRLLYSAWVVWYEVPYTHQQLVDACKQLVQKCWEIAWYIRPLIYFKPWAMGIKIKDPIPEVAISARKRWKYLSEDAIRVKISRFRRIHPDTTVIDAKISGHYVNSVLASQDVVSQWYDEALLLDTTWHVAEWPWANIFFVKKVADWYHVATPQTWHILPGLTRDAICTMLAKSYSIHVQQSLLVSSDLGWYDEAFFVWTAAEVTAIWSITDQDGTEYVFTSGQSDSFVSMIKHAYMDIVCWKNPEYTHRLS